MAKHDALMLGGDTGLSFPGEGKKKKKKKNKRGGAEGDGIFVDEVQDMAYEAAGAVGIEKFYFSNKMADIDADKTIPDEKKRDAKRDFCVKGLVATAIARRMLRRGTMLGSGARAAFAVAAVNLGQNL